MRFTDNMRQILKRSIEAKIMLYHFGFSVKVHFFRKHGIYTGLTAVFLSHISCVIYH